MKALLVLWIPLACSCVAPVNLTFDTAKTLRKGEVDVQGSFSTYLSKGENINSNFGGKLGIGITDTYTIKLRYEHLEPTAFFWSSDPLFSIDYVPVVDYFELENKITLGKSAAIGLPLAYYSWGSFSFDPRYYVTFVNRSKTIDCTFVPKIHILIYEWKYTSITPGIAFGMGISSDLDRWAIRPEIGWDGYTSYGVALTINLFTPNSQP